MQTGGGMDTNESLLRAILATVARGAFPPAVIYKIVAPLPGSDKQLVAYNLCDGQTPQAEIAKKAKLYQSNLSTSIARWIEAGVVVRVGKEQFPMHVYPLTKNDLKSLVKGG
jgi:DNA-binding HxlR family transcriptional regulator